MLAATSYKRGMYMRGIWVSRLDRNKRQGFNFKKHGADRREELDVRRMKGQGGTFSIRTHDNLPFEVGDMILWRKTKHNITFIEEAANDLGQQAEGIVNFNGDRQIIIGLQNTGEIVEW